MPLMTGRPILSPKALFALIPALLLAATAPRAAAAGPERITPSWEPVAPGVWKTTLGVPDGLTLLSAAGAQPSTAGLEAMPTMQFPLEESEIESRALGGKLTLRFPLALEEEVYGLGVDFESLRRTGSIFRLHVDHWGGHTGRTHAPVPFYVSSHGYGVFVDSARYLDVSVGVGVRLDAKQKPPVIDRTTGGRSWLPMPRSDSVEVLVPAAGGEVYVLAGPTPLDAVCRYNLFSGGGALPPMWGLGFMTRTPTAYSAGDALAAVAEFRKRRIPLDMIGLEPGWHDHAYPCSFQWDEARFPDPAAFLAELERQHVRANLWFNPYVSPTAPLHDRLLPYAGSHLVWNGIVPDYSMSGAREVFSEHLRRELLGPHPASLGGFKIDEVDGFDRWLWPDTAVFPSGNDAEQLRQTYGLLLQRLILDLYRGMNQRTLGQVRGTNGGAAALPFVIYNDNYAFAEYVTAMANSAFAGGLWSPEVRSGDGEDMLRRTQAVCFSPLALFNGWATTTKLWSHPDFTDHIRAAIQLRMLPYWYTAFAQYHYEGTPVVRAMPLVPGFDTTVEAKDQFMVGDALLVAPIAPGARTRQVVLPPGKWFDFYSGDLAGEGETIEGEPPLSQIPLFVKDGALVPMIGERQWMPGPEEALPLEVRHYGERRGETAVYDDDGASFDYERGEYSWTRLRVERDDGGWRGRVLADPAGRAWRYSDVRWTFMTR